MPISSTLHRSLPAPLAPNIAPLLEGIAQSGYAVTENVFPAEIIAALRKEACTLQQAGAMHQAGTGKLLSRQTEQQTPAAVTIRGDSIYWLQKAQHSVAQSHYLQVMDMLRLALNRHFYLGLFELETHFSLYPAGAFYRKHLDQFQHDQQRQLSFVLYLNDDWQASDGGQLRLYLEGALETESQRQQDKLSANPDYLDILPVGGTLVAFMSSRFWHEVLPAQRQRISLTGWFRTRAASPISEAD